MDDLIRQAADEYPLRTDGSDWDKVLGGLENAASSEPASTKKYWWLLLLLLPLASIILLLNKPVSTQQINADQATSTSAAPVNQSTAKVNANTNKQSLSELRAKDTSAITSVHTKTAAEKQNVLLQSKPSIGKEKALKNNNLPYVNNANTLYRKKNMAEKNNNTPINSSAPEVTNAGTGITNNSNNASNENTEAALVKKDMDKAVPATNNTVPNGNENKVAATPGATANKAAATPQQDSATTAKKASIKHTTPLKIKGLYMGLAGSLDASTVKFHSIYKVGYSASFLVGYRINNNWSVESGLLWDKKNYYSPGKYFDKGKTGLSSDYNIHYLNGFCKMFELPLNVKYDFFSKKQNGFYAVAGLSSYFMKKENYSYFTTHFSEPNVPGYFGNRDYKNSTTNLFSVINISGGYQFVFKNNNTLRIEPYFKVPLSGLGIGKLPFMSTGISAAYTLPLH